MIRLLIIDDDKLVCTSLKIILEASPEIDVAGLGGSGAEAIALYEKYRPDILLMDIRMEGMSGLEAGELILKRFPSANILFLTTFSDDAYIIRALRIGAKGYLLKQDFESILPALHAVMSGQSVFGREIVSKLPELMKKTEGFLPENYGITQKEMEIIEHIAKGLNNKEIAEKLFLSEGTVRNYLSIILEKLSLRDRTQLAIFYYKHI